ncbi:MAG: TIGR00269 family protein [Candidatus Woesearchaeota archaeon]|nr:MAG: TIGR00269 family protein [Candidatus Woesearchaeota archaeon]
MKCQVCNKQEAKIKLDHLGKTVCKNCFARSIERRIRRTIRDYNLLKDKDKILVAVSGGKDSSLTLTYLVNYYKYKPGKVFAVYVDRGDAHSVKQALAGEKLSKKLGVPFCTVSFRELFNIGITDIRRIAKKEGLNTCSVCGVFRRRALEIKARELKVDKVATGHNLTDEALSYLMNFSKGELKNFIHLGPISLPKRKGFTQRIKILSRVTDEEIREYVTLKRIKFYPNTCPCRVGSLRYNFLPVLADIKKARPGAEFSIVKIGEEIAELARNKHRDFRLNKCKKCGEPTSQDTCRVCEYLEI